MMAILILGLAAGPRESGARTLLDARCGRMLMEFAQDHDDPRARWVPLPRPSGREVELVRDVAATPAALEGFMRSLFPALPRTAPDRWERYFGYLWRRLPEVTVAPTEFSHPPRFGELWGEWTRFANALSELAAGPELEASPRRVPVEELRIKFVPVFRERLERLDPSLRRRIEATRFEGRAILALLESFHEDGEGLRNEDAAARTFRRMWRRVFQVAQPAEFEIVEPRDARAALERSKPGPSAVRLVEQFRLFKMVYNRNRPPVARPGELKR